MKILICTQIVDTTDPALGFFHGWIEEFATHAEVVHVICLKEGTHTLPKHVSVHSLGKEKRQSRLQYVLRFYQYIWRYRNEYDVVFVHMNPEYVVLGGLFWRLWGKYVSLWYTHRSITKSLRLAVPLMHHAFTGSVESFRIKTPKVEVTGQGVDTRFFEPVPTSHQCTLVVVGRVAPIKNLELAVDTLREVRKHLPEARLSIIGAPVYEEDHIYKKELEAYIASSGIQDAVDMKGGKDARGVRDELHASDVFLHTSKTNSADKTILEAMASGVYVISSSPVYQKDLPPDCIQPSEAGAYAAEIVRFFKLSSEEKSQLLAELRETVIERHSLARLIRLIVAGLSRRP